MSEVNKAVFLSYASQDAEVVGRMAESLRAAGVEVWFDRNELVGGDAWDQKIRKQIKECALFVPIISANTQARREGYFRIEWKLAAQRTHAIADGTPFLLPVAVDATRDDEALVPEEFRAVQWVRLYGNESPQAFCERVRRLIESGPGRPVEVGHARPGRPVQSGGAAAPATSPRGGWWAAAAIAAAVVAAGAWFWVQRTSSTPKTEAAPISEAKRLARKAQDLTLATELGMNELNAAALLCEQAMKLDPTDPEVWATASEVDTWKVYFGADLSEERHEAARKAAAQALSLAPNSFEARRAQACYLVGVVLQPVSNEAEPILRALRKERPHDRWTQVVLGLLLRDQGKYDEAAACFDELAREPGAAALAYNEKAWTLARVRPRPYEAIDDALDRSIAAQPFTGNVTLKAQFALVWHGDLDLALATVKKLPASTLLEDRGLLSAVTVYLWRREPQEVLALLNKVPRDWITWNYHCPKALLAGDAHEMLGQMSLAQIDWRKALALVDQRLASTPGDSKLLGWRAYLLLSLGDSAGRDALKLWRDTLAPDDPGLGSNYGLDRRIPPEEAMRLLEQIVTAPAWGVTLATMRLAPELDGLRGLQRFQALVAKMEADTTGRYGPKPKSQLPPNPSAAAGNR